MSVKRDGERAGARRGHLLSADAAPRPNPLPAQVQSAGRGDKCNSQFGSMLAQRISWPSPIGQKRMPETRLLNGPNHLVL